ncbi:unnamed protein product [Arabidopsis thaliana]|uniref:(thale cress) hypothetical protein n=1 Tax=Arabidopsis thaliana TaxID=3702 RepID=A0A7G2EYN7_ARATH|nr:unnamed protein product [Arabidopsis thaliana]
MMQPDHDLPYDLEGEILSHLPIQILARFRCVCKRWNTLFKERRFFNSDLGLARPQFILLAESKICSVDVNLDGPSIEVHNLPSDIPGYKLYMPMHVEYCDGLFLYATCYGIGICNPWLRQIRWFKSSYEGYDFGGMGYDNSRQDKHYKILGSYCTNTTMNASVTELGSDAWKSYEFAFHSWNLSMSITQHQVESRFAPPRGIQVSVGVGGDEWDDGFFDNVKEIIIHTNSLGIIFVKFYYRNGNVRVAGAAHGDSTETRGLMVPDDDYIEAVQGTYTESHITSMAFRLHKGNRSLRFGFFEGMSFVLGGARGSKIIGFYGRSSDLYLTAFGVHFSPLP